MPFGRPARGRRKALVSCREQINRYWHLLLPEQKGVGCDSLTFLVADAGVRVSYLLTRKGPRDTPPRIDPSTDSLSLALSLPLATPPSSGTVNSPVNTGPFATYFSCTRQGAMPPEASSSST